jgi:hypothetical protein
MPDCLAMSPTPTNPALEEIRARRAAEEDPFDQGRATAELRRQARATGSRERQAYEAGMEEAAEREKATTVQSPGSSAQAGPEGVQRAARGSSVRPRPLRGGGVVDNGAGVVLGLFGYALVINWIRGGSGQSWAWIRAKFMNQTGGPSAPPHYTGPPAPGYGGTPPIVVGPPSQGGAYSHPQSPGTAGGPGGGPPSATLIPSSYPVVPYG